MTAKRAWRSFKAQSSARTPRGNPCRDQLKAVYWSNVHWSLHRNIYDGTLRPPISGAHHPALAGAPRAIDKAGSRISSWVVENDSQARMAQFQSAEQRQNP